MSDNLSQLHRFYTDWSRHLTVTCIPLLQKPPSTDNNDAVVKRLLSYYDTLDRYAYSKNILYLLFPSWRSNSLESPILFLGDIHPHLFLSLVLSLVGGANQDLQMKHYISEIREEIHDSVSSLLDTMREAQKRFRKSFSDTWVSSFHSQGGRQSVSVMETAASVKVEYEEFVRIFGLANLLRKNTIQNIVGVIDAKQGALFLEGVCEFLAGFGSHQLAHVPAHQNYQYMMQQQQYAPYPPPNYTVRTMTQRQRQQHTTEPVHVIFVTNLALEVTRDMLLQRFNKYPSVRKAKIHHSQEYGFVSFADESEQLRAMQEMNGVMLLNRPMHIRKADKNII